MEQLPTNMTKNVGVFHAYSKTPVRIIPSSGQGAVQAGGTTIFNLPAGKTVDLKTFRVQFLGETNGIATDNVRFPKFMSSLIQELTITINGQTITIPNYNVIYHMVRDYSPDYERYANKLLNNADPSTDTTTAVNGTITQLNCYQNATVNADTVHNHKKLFVIDDWIGMLGNETQQSFFNTNLCGEFSVSILWANNNVLTRAGAGAVAPVYTLNDLVAFIDVIEFKDNSYQYAIENKIASGGIHEIPYKHYRLHTGIATTNNKETVLRITESTNSLDKIMFSYFPTDRGTDNLQLGNGLTAGATYANGEIPASFFNYKNISRLKSFGLLNNSKYFRRTGHGLGFNTARTKTATITMAIDGQDIFSNNLVSWYQETLKACGLNYENINGANTGIASFDEWLSNFFMIALSTSHIGGVPKGEYLISGIDSQATSLSIEVRVENQQLGADNSQAGLPYIVSEMTQELLIGAGRTIAIKQ